MAERYVISRGYGRCIEAAQAAHAAYWRAHSRMVAAQARGDTVTAGVEQSEMAACLRERAEWAEVARFAPRFVEEARG